jgi:hypothetical protein
MTVRRTYECNLCHGSDESMLIGIYWASSKPFTEFVQKGTREVEHHLCYGCLRAAQNITVPKGKLP